MPDGSAAVAPTLIEEFRSSLAMLAPDDARIGLAVSGGADSLALLALATHVRPQQIAVATVDHGLRPESADEAAQVAGLCAGLGVPHHVLTVTVDRDRESVQAAARRVRYLAVGDWAQAHGLPFVATAHHLDDQAESLLMRLNRGSGLRGMAAMAACRPLPVSDAGMGGQDLAEHGPRLIRPLLSWRRTTLRDIVAATGWRIADDPSNDDPRYDRTIARRLLAEHSWLHAERLAECAAHLGSANAALEWMVDQLWEARAVIDGDAEVMLRLDGDLPHDLLARLVERALLRVCPATADRMPRGDQLVRLIATLQAGGAATLAGVLARPIGEVWRFSPAPPRRPTGRSERSG